MLLLTLLPALTGTGMASFIEEDDIPDEDDFSFISTIPVAWIRIPVHQSSMLLRLGISIFALFVVYLGGRSKHRRFNDRTIDANTVLRDMCMSLKAALCRAVFNFLNSRSDTVHARFTVGFFLILSPYSGGTKS